MTEQDNGLATRQRPIGEFLTIEQACALMKISRRTLTNWMSAGLPFVALTSRCTMVHPTDLYVWSAKHRRDAWEKAVKSGAFDS